MQKYFKDISLKSHSNIIKRYVSTGPKTVTIISRAYEWIRPRIIIRSACQDVIRFKKNSAAEKQFSNDDFTGHGHRITTFCDKPGSLGICANEK